MEMVDLLNNRKELIGQQVDKHLVPDGSFRLSVHAWIIDDNGNLLIQQRLATAHKFPNMWSNTGGAVDAGESSLDAVIRELDEELGIKVTPDDLELIVSYKRIKDYADVWVLKKNINIENLVLQKDEVQDVKWASLQEFENMIANGTAIKSSFDYYMLYLNQ